MTVEEKSAILLEFQNRLLIGQFFVRNLFTTQQQNPAPAMGCNNSQPAAQPGASNVGGDKANRRGQNVSVVFIAL
jgi:hypothetical protein